MRNGSDAVCGGADAASGGGASTGGTYSNKVVNNSSSGGANAAGGMGATAGVVEAGFDAPDAPVDVDAGALDIELRGASSVCAGHSFTAELIASGGVPPYTWRLEEPSSWALDRTTGPSVSISGTATDPGKHDISVNLRDANGDTTVAIPFEVVDAPHVVDTSLPPACVGQSYAFALTAMGGDPASYRWSAVVPDGGVLELNGGTVSVLPNEEGSTEFTVTVADDHCTSEPVELTLRVQRGCPTIAPAVLPQPCAGTEYASPVAVEATGGSGPYTFAALSTPSGLNFDPVSRTVFGDGNAAGTVVLQVTDGAGHQVLKNYTFEPRSTCWLAYTSQTNAVSKLHFFDPVLQLDRLFDESSGITDFKFSPDGKHLVYRASAAGVSRLVLIDGPGWTPKPLAFSGSVDRYSWSPDSRIVAVAFHDGSTAYVGAVTVSGVERGEAVDAGMGRTDAGPGHGAMLIPVETQMDTDPVWLTNTQAAFLAPMESVGGDVLLTAQFASVAVSPVVEVHPRLTVGSTAVVQPTARGVFVIDPDFGSVGFHGSIAGPDAFVDDFGTAFSDPEGRYSAQVNAGSLSLFQAVKGGDDVPWATSTVGCDALLAWAPQVERIACVSDALPLDKGTIFDIDGLATALLPVPISGTKNYTVGASTNHRRAFSPSGDWFAFATLSALYRASLRDGTPHAFPSDSPASPPQLSQTDDLAFSPDETRLLWQAGTELKITDLLGGAGSLYLEGGLLAAPQCTEDFTQDPGNWCGRSSGTSVLAWSADSRFVAFRMSSGIIEIKDVHDLSLFKTARACSAACGSQFSFQP